MQRIIPDPKAPGMYLALIEPNSYLDFANPVPFNDVEGPVERGLLNDEGRLSGRAQSAVRPISDADFIRIVNRGLEDSDPLLPREGAFDQPTGLEESQAPYVFEMPRDRVLQLTSRAVRDRVFRRIVLRAYDERCAVTGLKLINGGGRAEVNAAHIRPVEADGPDTVHNGLALSGTAHWMFDRGLISLGDDLQILISRHANDPDGVRAFINRSGFAAPPINPKDRPHPQFLAWHRENCFKPMNVRFLNEASAAGASCAFSDGCRGAPVGIECATWARAVLKGPGGDGRVLSGERSKADATTGRLLRQCE